jgi:hypothetical protein
MNRLLMLAQFLCGDHIRDSVFEPLVADAQEEIRQSRLPALTRARWQLAMIYAMLACAPRMLVLPPALLTDLLVRAAAFGALAFLLELAFAASGRPGVLGPLANSLPFMVMPIVWRVHVSALPDHHRRFVALVITVASALVMAMLAGPPIEMRAALAAMAVGVASIGWRMGDHAYGAQSPIMSSVLVRGLMIGTAYQFAGWFPQLASGHPLLAPYWPGTTMFTSVIGIAISASVIKRWHVEPGEKELMA